MNEKQRKFALEYVKDLSPKNAAIRAGYAASNADVTGAKLLAVESVRDLIAAQARNIQAQTRYDARWLHARLGQLLDADSGDLFEPDGTLKPIDEWPEIFRKGLVAGFKIRRDTRLSTKEVTTEIIEIKLADRNKQLELIGRHVAVGAWSGTEGDSMEGGYRTIRRVIVEQVEESRD